ncbi:MAG: transcription-repair coupling factor [Candidatus Omnitrophota bacterium]|nr:MAG: transcription-repair coupling factor [Candidatus Omnitrophota bacterium]
MFKTLKLYRNQCIELENLLAYLLNFGYKRQESVSEEGDFARRGGIVDIFALTFEMPLRIELEADKILNIRTFDSASGKILWEHEIVIILPIKKAYSFREGILNEQIPISPTLDLKDGDYVVHTEYGIGRYLGRKKIKIKDEQKDCLVIQYDLQEKLYVPIEQSNLIQKYLAFHAKRPKLYRLGSRDWARTKERTRKGIRRLAWELLSLQAIRLNITRPPYAKDGDWQKEFEDSFAYTETPDQIKATREVKSDMESERPMDRLICGDVGYGKTEVAMRAAFKCIMSNKQAAFLVPTTILAQQHFQNFSRRLKNFPVNVAMLCRFNSLSQQKEIVEGLANGVIDVVIGTHRLLSEDIKFKNLGLIIIDEEQRFGVKAKEKLKTIRLNADVLTLTATPIPRTLYMSMMAVKDLSVINTAPQERLPIKTIVVEYDDEVITQAISKEIKRGGQVYFVHNRVEDILKVSERISKSLPSDARIAVAHGQMPAKELEKVMAEFLSGKIDILICTMIIESGIDIPNANTIIVNQAQSFGLSDLHQLRGRVGRFNRAAYAYFLLPRHQVLDSDAEKRIKAIQEYSHLGAGFKIAMQDLEIRGAGNLLGVQQHGFVEAIGFDLYCRLLREAVVTQRRAMNAVNN